MPETTTATGNRQQPHQDGSSPKPPPPPNIQVEFAVNVSKPDDLDKIDKLLKNDGHKLLSSHFESKTIKLEFENRANEQVRSVQRVQDFIEKQTGFLAVIKGVGELASAVSELRPSEEAARKGYNFHGVVRLSQLAHNLCYVDGSASDTRYKLDKPEPSLSLAIHEFGDLGGDKYEFIGEPVIDIATRELDDVASISVSRIVPDCNVAEMIGRSIALTRVSAQESKLVLSAGVVARASIVQQNTKQVCSCSGKTLWEERVDRKTADEQ